MFGLFQHVTQRFNVNREIIIYKINFYKSASVKIEKALKVEVKACESFHKKITSLLHSRLHKLLVNREI